MRIKSSSRSKAGKVRPVKRMIGESGFITQIREGYGRLTKAEKKVADFILEKPQEVMFMSITDLADACRVGETTVFRFCKTMRVQGYQEFKIKLSLSLKEDTSMESSIPVPNEREEGGIYTQKLLEANCNVLRETDALIDREVLQEVLDHMKQAGKLLFCGVGTSGQVATLAASKFLRITRKVCCFTDFNMQAMAASLLNPGDVLCVISYSGSTRDSILNAKLAKEAGAYVVAITRYAKSPLAEYADACILCGAKEAPLQINSSTAIISKMYIIQILYTEYFRQTYEVSAVCNEKTANSIVDKMY